MALWWLIAAIGLAIAEIFTSTFVLLMLAAGGLAASAAAYLDAPLWAQIALFAIVSTLALVAVRPAIRRHLARPNDHQRMGVEAIEGASALVLEQVDADGGLVKIEGELWRARAYDGTQVIQAGERVQVVQVAGATLMVWRD